MTSGNGEAGGDGMQTREDIRAAEVRHAMSTAGTMEINGVAGRWNEAGDEWTADDPHDTDTLIMVRISDADPGDVQGVARQIARTCAHAAQTGARVRMILVENDTSAFKRRKIVLPNGDKQLRTVRPKFRRALSLLAGGIVRRLTTYHLDRTVRDPRDLEDLIDVVEESSPRVVCDSVTGSLRLANDSDVTTARILVAVANQASRDTARRVREKRREQAEEGRFGGGPRRYGFEPDGSLRESEAGAIRLGTELTVAQAKPMLREITRDVNARGYRDANGRPFRSEQFRDLLLRPCNAGLSVHRSGVRGRVYYTPDDVVGSLPHRIVEPDEYWSVVHKLTDPDRTTNAGTTPKWFGSGIYQCPCGDTMRVQRREHTRTDRRTGEQRQVERHIYRCQSTDSGHATCPMQELDALVIGTVLELLANSDPADIIGPSSATASVPALRAEIARHKERLNEIAADRDEDLITRSQMLTQTAKRRAKLERAQADLEAALANLHPAARVIGADDIQAAWDELEWSQQREIVRRMLRVKVRAIGRGTRLPVRDRVSITRAPRTSPPPATQAAHAA
ncbi:recombinase family protein [Actinomadura sp. 6N118]|uniref:recombinase family protein n=1 Tax=Actinomadura sp. 6N118 TaxID=3375151 RepID=UPI0037B26BCC